MMHEPVTVLLMGIGGYGEVYVSALLDEDQGKRCKIVGAVDPEPSRSSRLSDLQRLSVPTYASLDLFFRDGSADLAVVSSPIQLHAEHVEEILTHGSHVLVEKPAAASVKDVDRMMASRNRMERFVAVGYQWSFAGSILRLKDDILRGMFGAPRRGKCIALWPRTESYYSRNEWAGKARDTAGRPILDSPANNAMAHFLHNLLFLFGDEGGRAAEPLEVDARLGRANDIETFDTVVARIRTANDTELLFIASHAIGDHEAVEPRFQLEFEEAVVDFPGDMEPVTARFKDGTTIEYPSPNASNHTRKLWTCVNAVLGGGVIPCGLEAARPQVQCIEMIHDAEMQVHCFAKDRIKKTKTRDGPLRWVDGLADAMEAAYASGEMVSF
jgi:predicted dehydrogenase